MCRPHGILAKARLRTTRRSLPAPFVGCVYQLGLIQRRVLATSTVLLGEAILVRVEFHRLPST